MNRVIDDMIHERIPQSPPVVPPVTDGHRPKWSIMIPVYNCSVFLVDTLTSVLEECRDRDDVQIEVVDDASTDADIETIVRTIGSGKVAYFRQPQNVGSLLNFHTCLLRAKGNLIHLLHGDDRILKGFYLRFDNFFEKFPSAGAAYCRFSYIDQSGKLLYHHEKQQADEGLLHNFVSELGVRQRIQYAAIVVRREVYESLGGFYGVEYGEDWEMWMRIAYHYPVGYIPDVLAEYRRHMGSISGRAFLTGKNIQDLHRVMTHIEPLLPRHEKNEIVSSSKKFYAHYALRTANQIWSVLRNHQGAKAQMREAWKMSRDLMLFVKILKLYTKMTFKL